MFKHVSSGTISTASFSLHLISPFNLLPNGSQVLKMFHLPWAARGGEDGGTYPLGKLNRHQAHATRGCVDQYTLALPRCNAWETREVCQVVSGNSATRVEQFSLCLGIQQLELL